MIRYCIKCGKEITNTHHNSKLCDECVKINKRVDNKKRKENNTIRNKNRDYSLDVGVKRCSKCREYKEYSEFNKCYGTTDGYKTHCRACQHTFTPEQKERREVYEKSERRKENQKIAHNKRKEMPEYKEKERIKSEKAKQKRREENKNKPKIKREKKIRLQENENSRKQDKIIWSLIEGNCMLEAICLELGITKEDDGKDGREIRERLYPNN